MTDITIVGPAVERPTPTAELLTATQQIAAWVAGLPSLPADDGNRYSIRRLTVAWVLQAWGKSPHTAKAYRRDLSTYLDWCAHERLDPRTARPTDVAQYRVWRERQGTRGRPAQPATVARALAAASSWYEHLVINTDGTVARNPVAGVERPPVSKNSTTAGLTLDEVDQLLAQADAEATTRHTHWQNTPTARLHVHYLAAMRDRALLRLLADLGLRISEALQRDLTDLSYQRGQRTLRFIGKGGRPRERPLVPNTLEALDEYLAARAAAAGSTVDALAGPIFATAGTDGQAGRLAEPNVFTTLRRLATAAGITSANRLSPHSLRHAFVTGARELGKPLEDVQDAMDHADPRTTRRYDRDRNNLNRDPAHTLGAHRVSQRRAAAPPDEARPG